MKTLSFILALLIPACFSALASDAFGPEQALRDSLRMLNNQSNPTRLKVLEAKSENCIVGSEECARIYEEFQNNSYLFVIDDVVSISYLGDGDATEPCKSDVCHGFDRETKEYLLAMRSVNNARWWTMPGVIFLSFSYVKATSQFDGKITQTTELRPLQNQISPQQQ